MARRISLIRNCKQEKAWATKKNKAEHATSVNPVQKKETKSIKTKKEKVVKK